MRSAFLQIRVMPTLKELALLGKEALLAVVAQLLTEFAALKTRVEQLLAVTIRQSGMSRRASLLRRLRVSSDSWAFPWRGRVDRALPRRKEARGPGPHFTHVSRSKPPAPPQFERP